MPLAIPPELKKIKPFVLRAEELDRDKSPESRLVAYYLRQYAVHLGIPLSSSSPPSKVCLGHLLADLEKEKPAMDNFSRDEAAYVCRQFANGVFDKANSEDRMGLASKTTAKTFYAASSFLQMLEQFSEPDSEERAEEKKRILYAKWKSTDILKAIQEGRQPAPGAYGEDEEEDDEEEVDKNHDAPVTVETVESEEEKEEVPEDKAIPPPVPMAPLMPPKVEEENNDQGQEVELPPPAYPGPPEEEEEEEEQSPPKLNLNRPPVTFNLPPPPVIPPPMPAPTPTPAPAPAPRGLFGFGKKAPAKISKAQLADAVELTRFALAALEDKDADLGAERLQQALHALGR